MNVFESIKKFLEKRRDNEDVVAPEGFCPNCWGRQEYEDMFFEAMKVESVNTNNLSEKKGWIQAYVEKNLSGIVLKEQDAAVVCNVCSVNYAAKE